MKCGNLFTKIRMQIISLTCKFVHLKTVFLFGIKNNLNMQEIKMLCRHKMSLCVQRACVCAYIHAGGILLPSWEHTTLSLANSWTELLRRMPSSGMLHRVALVRTDVSEERSASIIRVTRIGELGTSGRLLRLNSTLTILAEWCPLSQ
jgi:hypothetical protein